MFKKYFIPHEGNNHQPHILRRRAVFAILSLLLLFEAAFLLQILFVWPLTNIFSSVLPGVLVQLANDSRAQNSVPALKTNPLLEQAAQLKARDMAAKDYFEHTSPQGLTPWYWLQKVGYKYSVAGENLAINFFDSSDIENAWMDSLTHRANILDNRFSEIGIAAVKGTYQGKETVFVVQFFGRPQAQAAVKPVLTKSPTVSPSAAPQKTPLATPASAPSVASESWVLDYQPSDNASSGVIAGLADLNIEVAPAAAPISLLRRWLSMPKAVTSTIYLTIAAIFLVALAFKIFIKIKIQYPKMIFNGALVLFVIISLLYLNFLIVGQGQI